MIFHNSLAQTCERYGAEAKYKVSCTVTTATASNFGIEHTTIPLLGPDDSVDGTVEGDITGKRKANDEMDAESELQKRQKVMETSDKSGEISQL